MNEGCFNVSKPNGWKMKVWLTLIILSGIVFVSYTTLYGNNIYKFRVFK